MVFHADIGIHPLKPGVLCCKLFEAFNLFYTHPAIFGFPVVKSCLANTILPADIPGGNPCLLLLNNRNNLCLRKPCPFHPFGLPFKIRNNPLLQCPFELNFSNFKWPIIREADNANKYE